MLIASPVGGTPMVMSCAEIAGMLTAPGQYLEIETVLVDGHPVRVWKNAPRTIPQIVARSREHGGKDFIVCGEQRLCFDTHYAHVAALASSLVDEAGLRPGDRVAVAMRNRPEWSVAFNGGPRHAAGAAAQEAPCSGSADRTRTSCTRKHRRP